MSNLSAFTSVHPTFVPFRLLSFLFRNFNFRRASSLHREAISLYRSIYSRMDLLSAKLITFRKYTVQFSWIAFVSIGLSTYRNLDYPVYCCFAFFSLSLCHSIFVSRFSCLRRVRVTWRNWSSPDWRCKPGNIEAIYTI